MNESYRLNRTTEIYLATFYCILEDMVHGMTCVPLTDSISHNFIVQMIPHHRAAIEMSRNILKYTACKPVQEIAEGIITEQTKSIANMKEIEPCCSRCTNTRQELRLYQSHMDQIMRTMFHAMRHARATDQPDCNFMWEMIPHHEGAVRMSETTLQAAICPELIPILNAIISSQKKGITEMQKLLQLYCC